VFLDSWIRNLILLAARSGDRGALPVAGLRDGSWFPGFQILISPCSWFPGFQILPRLLLISCFEIGLPLPARLSQGAKFERKTLSIVRCSASILRSCVAFVL
jgi:hypothetical protein